MSDLGQRWDFVALFRLLAIFVLFDGELSGCVFGGVGTAVAIGIVRQARIGSGEWVFLGVAVDFVAVG